MIIRSTISFSKTPPGVIKSCLCICKKIQTSSHSIKVSSWRIQLFKIECFPNIIIMLRAKELVSAKNYVSTHFSPCLSLGLERLQEGGLLSKGGQGKSSTRMASLRLEDNALNLVLEIPVLMEKYVLHNMECTTKIRFGGQMVGGLKSGAKKENIATNTLLTIIIHTATMLNAVGILIGSHLNTQIICLENTKSKSILIQNLSQMTQILIDVRHENQYTTLKI